MKELEALNRVSRSLYEDNVYRQYTNSHEPFEADIEVLRKALTPPTSDEVCKALSEYLKRDVKINSDKAFYYSEERQYYGECDEIICGYGWEDGCISFEIDLPPHLITLIGRFYEGVKE
mgnify:CR=1 FL=1